VFGHRGAAAVAPENTLASFALAEALGAEYLELDVHASSDGTIVVLHDSELDRTTDGNGQVCAQAWHDLQRLDAGHHFRGADGSFPYRGQGVRIPALEEVLRAFPRRFFNIEIKQADPSIVGDVVALLHACGAADRTLLAAARDDVMAEIRAAVGNSIATGSSAGEVAAFIDRCERDDWDGYRHPGVALQIPPSFAGQDLVTPRTIAAAHRLDVEVHVWTINSAREIEQLLDLGVDGIMSDAPGLVRRAIDRRR
jgi:glycerophosphoryl diester phosphodiesterase